MAITFNQKYPAALTNAAWQKKKSFKDKTKSKTKTGLGTLLTKAEANWGKIKFDKLIAAKQSLQGKNVAALKIAAKAAQDYLDGPVVQQAIAALDAAASKARTTAANTALSTTAATAATALTGALTAQAKLLRDIKLADFQPATSVHLEIGEREKNHTAYLRSMDGIVDELRSGKTKENWEGQPINEVVNNAVKVTGLLFEATADPHWHDTNNLWREIFDAYTTANNQIKVLPGSRVEDEIEKFTDLAEQKLGHVWR